MSTDDDTVSGSEAHSTPNLSEAHSTPKPCDSSDAAVEVEDHLDVVVNEHVAMQSSAGTCTEHSVRVTGDLPVVLSAPHGGTRSPSGWQPIRAKDCKGNALTQTPHRPRDAYTTELTIVIAEYLQRLSGGRKPCQVYSKVHRQVVDPNRDGKHGDQAFAPGCREAEEAHGAYHTRMRDAIKNASDSSPDGAGKCLLVLDIHGTRDAKSNGLAEGEGYLNAIQVGFGTAYPARLLRDKDKSVKAFVRGPDSIGTKLCEWGLQATPSKLYRHPPPNDVTPYYSGGYITKKYSGGDVTNRHGEGKGVIAVQLEFPLQMRKDWKGTARKVAPAILEFLSKNPDKFGRIL